MKKLIKFKYKIYRRFQCDLWGLLMLKNKRDNLFKFILLRFNYLVRNLHKTYFSKNFKFLNANSRKSDGNILHFKKNFFKKFYTTKKKISGIFDKKNNSVIKSKYNKRAVVLIKKSYYLFWMNFFKVYFYFFKNLWNLNTSLISLKNNITFLIIYIKKKFFFYKKK